MSDHHNQKHGGSESNETRNNIMKRKRKISSEESHELSQKEVAMEDAAQKAAAKSQSARAEVNENQVQPETEMQSQKDGIAKPKDEMKSSRVQEPLSSFMGIMDFVQPGGLDIIFADMGMQKPTEQPKKVEPVPQAIVAAELPTQQLEPKPQVVVESPKKAVAKSSPAKEIGAQDKQLEPSKNAPAAVAQEEQNNEAEKMMSCPAPAPAVKETLAPSKQIDGNADVDQDDSSSSSGMSSSSDSKSEKDEKANGDSAEKKEQERRQLIEKLRRMKELLKQKQLTSDQHKQQIMKVAKTEQKRQDKEKRKQDKAAKKAVCKVTTDIKIKPVAKPKAAPSEKKVVKKSTDGGGVANIQKKPLSAAQNSTPAAYNEEDIDFTLRLHCVDELAVRWWYALPAWPPADFNYAAALASHSLRAVDVDTFRSAPEFDLLTGFKKVHAVECYVGIYRDLEGNMYDLRPKESAPSLRNLQRMPLTHLHQLLQKAYSEQLEALQKVEAENIQYDRQIEAQIKKSLEMKVSKLQRVI